MRAPGKMTRGSVLPIFVGRTTATSLVMFWELTVARHQTAAWPAFREHVSLALSLSDFAIFVDYLLAYYFSVYIPPSSPLFPPHTHPSLFSFPFLLLHHIYNFLLFPFFFFSFNPSWFLKPGSAVDNRFFSALFWSTLIRAVYLMVLQAMGVVSEVIRTSGRRQTPIFGYSFIAGWRHRQIAASGFLEYGGASHVREHGEVHAPPPPPPPPTGGLTFSSSATLSPFPSRSKFSMEFDALIKARFLG